MSSYIRHSYYLIRLYQQLYTTQLLSHQIIWAVIYDTVTISSDYMSSYIRHSYYLIRLYEQLYTTQLLSHQSIGNSYNKHRQHQYYVFCIQKGQVRVFVLLVKSFMDRHLKQLGGNGQRIFNMTLCIIKKRTILTNN